MYLKSFIFCLLLIMVNISYNNEIINLKKFHSRGKSPVFQICIYDDSTAFLKGISNIEYIGEFKANIRKYYPNLVCLLDSINLDTLQEKYNFRILDYPVTKIIFNYKGKNKSTSFKKEAPIEIKKLSDYIVYVIIKNSQWEKIKN